LILLDSGFHRNDEFRFSILIYFLYIYKVFLGHDTRSYFKTSPHAQSLCWIEEANPRNPAKGGITVVVLLDPHPLKVRDLRLALNLIVVDPGL